MNGAITGIKAKPSGVVEVDMKVGDLIRFRYPEPSEGDMIAIVVGTTNHPDSFDVLELTGPYTGKYNTIGEEEWEVISESR